MGFTYKGTKGNDTQAASDGSGWTMYGYAGNDTLAGGAGIDNIQGGDGKDILFGLGGNDKLSGGRANDSLDGGAGGDKIDGGSGNDTLLSGTDANTDKNLLAGGSGNDDMTGDAGLDTMRGDSGHDTMSAASGKDNMDGGDGNDIMAGGAGADTMKGGNGNDSLTGDTDATGEVNKIYGDAGHDTIVGGSVSNVLYGGTGNDSITGGAGTDTIHGGTGGDTIDGAGGVDTVSYFNSTKAVKVDLATALQVAEFSTGVANGDAALDSITLLSVDNLTGSKFGDSLTGDGAANTINGGGGADTITGAGGADALNGGDGRDTFVHVAGDGADAIDGGSLADLADYSASTAAVVADLSGGTVVIAGVTDTLTSLEQLKGGTVGDTLTAIGAGNGKNATFGIISGAVGYVDGFTGNDTLFSADQGSGSALLYGGAGNDTYNGVTNADASDWFGLAGTAAVTANVSDSLDTIKGFDEGDGDKLFVKLSDFGFAAVAAVSATQNGTATIGTGTGLAIAQYSNSAITSGADAGKYALTGIQLAGDALQNITTSGAVNATSIHTATTPVAHAVFIYNQSDNSLWYDANGTSGTNDAVKIAQFDTTGTGVPNVSDDGVTNAFDTTDFVFGNI